LHIITSHLTAANSVYRIDSNQLLPILILLKLLIVNLIFQLRVKMKLLNIWFKFLAM